MRVRLANLAPGFSANTTDGRLTFHPSHVRAGPWCFGIPAISTPVGIALSRHVNLVNHRRRICEIQPG